MEKISCSKARSNYQLVISFLSACYLHLHSTFFRLIGWIYVIGKYYCGSPAFAWTDTLLWMQYLFKSPYRHAKAFCRENLYGETPLTTLEKIAKKGRLLSCDVVYEIGAGTARTAFWLHHFVKCRVVAIEHVPIFMQRANRVKKWRRLQGVTLENQDVLMCDLTPATWIYFYGTARDTSFILAFIDKLASLPSHVKIITTSYSLADYDTRFESTWLCKGLFPWGRADVYMNRLAIQL